MPRGVLWAVLLWAVPLWAVLLWAVPFWGLLLWDVRADLPLGVSHLGSPIMGPTFGGLPLWGLSLGSPIMG